MERQGGGGLVQAEPLSMPRLRAALGASSLWADLRVVAQTGSTNADVLALARDGAGQGLVLAAEAQTAGRGRQGRDWVSLPGAALTFSILLTPALVPRSACGWAPLLAGVAVTAALRAETGLDAWLKWPNDVLVNEGKLAGILAEQDGDAIVVGIGINVLGQRRELPVATATSLEALGAGQADRTSLLAEILRQLEHWYLRWAGPRVDPGSGVGPGDADACGLRPAYLAQCATIGRQVRVELPGDRRLTGMATGVDDTGRLLVRPAGADIVAVSAGDVVHVR